MSETTKLFKKQLPKNALMAGLSFVVYSLSAIWLTPYLVKHLGAAAYGLIPLAALFTQYFSLIASRISGSIYRFLAVEVAKPDGQPNLVFNSALALYMLLIVLQIPLFGLGLSFLDQIFHIPDMLRWDAYTLFVFSILGYLISLVGSAFSVSQFACNRLDIESGIQTVSVVIRISLIVFGFLIFGPRLSVIGVADFILSIFRLIVSVIYWKRLTPELYISFRSIRLRLLGPILGLSFWSLFNAVGDLLYRRTDLWLINRFISAEATGFYATLLVISNFIRQLSGVASNQVGPVILAYWAKGETSDLALTLRQTMKVLALLLSIPLGMLSANSETVLSLWLGVEFNHLASLLIVVLLPLYITGATCPLFHLPYACNSMRLPSVITFVLGVLNLFLSYYLGVTMSMGVQGVAVVTAVTMIVKDFIFYPYYSARLLGSQANYFCMPLLIGVLAVLINIVFYRIPFWMLIPGLKSGSFMYLLVQGIFVSVLFSFLSWFVFFSKNERTDAKTFVKTIFSDKRLPV